MKFTELQDVLADMPLDSTITFKKQKGLTLSVRKAEIGLDWDFQTTRKDDACISAGMVNNFIDVGRVATYIYMNCPNPKIDDKAK